MTRCDPRYGPQIPSRTSAARCRAPPGKCSGPASPAAKSHPEPACSRGHKRSGNWSVRVQSKPHGQRPRHPTSPGLAHHSAEAVGCPGGDKEVGRHAFKSPQAQAQSYSLSKPSLFTHLFLSWGFSRSSCITSCCTSLGGRPLPKFVHLQRAYTQQLWYGLDRKSRGSDCAKSRPMARAE